MRTGVKSPSLVSDWESTGAMKAQRVITGSTLLSLVLETVACGLVLNLVWPAAASDWPQFLGPTRDAVYAGPALAEDWPREGPKMVWQADVGQGYSSPVVAEGRLVICHRLEDNLVVDCLEATTSTKQWTFRRLMQFSDGAHFDSGPRPTPTIKDSRVFVKGPRKLVCVDLRAESGLVKP